MRSIVALAVAVLCGLSLLRADAADPNFAGSWMTEVEMDHGSGKVENRSFAFVWKIVNGSELITMIASVEHGTLSTNPETWAVRRADHSGDVAHGSYRLLGANSFSTRIAGLPPDDIIWKRVAAEGKSSRVPACLLKLIAPAAANSARSSFNAALAGLWEASYSLNGTRRETVWRITPDGQSLRLDVELRPMTYTIRGAQLKVSSPDGAMSEFTLRFSGRDTMETVSGDERLRWSRCAE